VRELRSKGISPVIAVLLLIVIAVAAAILTYVWLTGYMGTLQAQSGGQQLQERIRVEAVQGAGSDTLIVYFRNIGKTKVTIDAAYLINATNGNVIASETGIGATLDPGDSDSAKIDTRGVTWEDGATYIVKVVTETGTEATYQFLYRE